jgi:hypothetical protein
MQEPEDSRTQAAHNETSTTLAELEALRQRLATLEAHLAATRNQPRAWKFFRPGPARNFALLAIAALLAGALISRGDAIKALFISPSGDVGIGNIDPAQKLDVAGTIRSRTGGFQFPDGTQQATAAVTIPAGAVVPFNLGNCPAGWTDYMPAYGRFIRGIDKSGQSIDPGGRRNVNDLQDYAIPQITGKLTGVEGGTNTAWPWGFKPGTSGAFDVSAAGYPNYNKYNGDYFPAGGSGQAATFDSKRVLPNNTAPESRPRNVALLYCQKS